MLTVAVWEPESDLECMNLEDRESDGHDIFYPVKNTHAYACMTHSTQLKIAGEWV